MAKYRIVPCHILTEPQAWGGEPLHTTRRKPQRGLLAEADLTLEVVLLLLAGMAMLLLAIMLVPVYTGTLPYYENGLFGLLLVVFSLQALSLGKTPFGDWGGYRALLVGGIAVGAVGIVTCFIPDALGPLPRLLLTLFFCGGGLLLFLQMLLAKDKARLWRKLDGPIFRHLTLACGACYLLQIAIGLLIFQPDLAGPLPKITLAAVFGCSLVYLALVLRRIHRLYPSAGEAPASAFPIDKAVLLLTGVYMVLLGLLLLPVNLGKLPFSGSAQLGLMMIILAVQMLALGNTPVGAFPRSWLMIALGFIFAGLGIVSCIIPGVLVGTLTILVGVLNIAGGIVALVKVVPQLLGARGTKEPVPSLLVRLDVTTLVMNLLTILFGLSMLAMGLFAGPIPKLLLGPILAANGGALLYLLHLLLSVERMQKQAAQPAEP